MTNDPKTLRPVNDIFRDLRELLDSCADANRHDQAIVGINFCIDEGIDLGSQIIGFLRRVGFNPRHIGKLLHDLSGNNPARHRWQRGDDDRYRILPDA